MGEGRRGALPLDPAKGLPLEPLTEGADPLWDDWDTPLQAPKTPVFHLDGFEGPMDLLLDLAERQRIDLGQLSFADLAGQFVAECEGRLRGMPLERRADWLVMAARLLLLRSRLLFPADAAAAAEAGRDAQGRTGPAGAGGAHPGCGRLACGPAAARRGRVRAAAPRTRSKGRLLHGPHGSVPCRAARACVAGGAGPGISAAGAGPVARAGCARPDASNAGRATGGRVACRVPAADFEKSGPSR